MGNDIWQQHQRKTGTLFRERLRLLVPLLGLGFIGTGIVLGLQEAGQEWRPATASVVEVTTLCSEQSGGQYQPAPCDGLVIDPPRTIRQTELVLDVGWPNPVRTVLKTAHLPLANAQAGQSVQVMQDDSDPSRVADPVWVKRGRGFALGVPVIGVLLIGLWFTLRSAGRRQSKNKY